MEPGPPHLLPEEFVQPIEANHFDDVEVEEHETKQSASSARPKKPRAKPATDRTPGQSLLPISKVDSIVQSDGKSSAPGDFVFSYITLMAICISL